MTSLPARSPQNLVFQISAQRLVYTIFGVCLASEIGLVLIDATVNYYEWIDSPPIQRLLNITREDGVASWFAVTQTCVVALICWALVFVAGQREEKVSNISWGWLVTALIFTYLAFDDGSKFHERIATAFDYAMESQTNPSGFWASIAIDYPSYSWQLLFLPVFSLFGGFLLWFFWTEFHNQVDRGLILVAFGCLAIAVGLDFLEGLDNGYRWIQETFKLEDYTVTHFSKSLEEFLEMLGMTCFLVLFFKHLAHVDTQMTLVFSKDS